MWISSDQYCHGSEKRCCLGWFLIPDLIDWLMFYLGFCNLGFHQKQVVEVDGGMSDILQSPVILRVAWWDSSMINRSYWMMISIILSESYKSSSSAWLVDMICLLLLQPLISHVIWCPMQFCPPGALPISKWPTVCYMAGMLHVIHHRHCYNLSPALKH